MRMITALFSRRWLLVTLVVVILLAIMVRLGFWQLDRRADRRANNARIIKQLQLETLELAGTALQSDLAGMEYRSVSVTGRYDFENQVTLRNQAYQLEFGAHLLTPLKIEGSNLAVLVDRGWIPQDSYLSGDWDRYNEPGLVRVHGVIRRAQGKPEIGSIGDPVPAAGEPPLLAWNLANVAAIARQIPYDLLPVYIQKSPDPQNPTPPYPDTASMTQPYPVDPPLDLTEGNHLSYALQWFTFAAIFLVGYPVFVNMQDRKNK
jgi:surfeit locus 1 family protein